MTLRPWLLAVLLAAAGAVGGAAVLAGQTVRGDSDVRRYLLAHPEVLTEAMQVLRDRETAQLVAPHRPAILRAFPGAVGGDLRGDVTIATYMDYACGFCRASLADLDRVVREDGRVRVVYHELPILSADSRTGALWALAAAEQGRYMAFHTRLFAAGRPTPAAIADAAAAAGLDRTRAQAVIASAPVATELTDNLATARALGMSGTPAWVIGDRVLSGAIGYEALKAAVAAARARR